VAQPTNRSALGFEAQTKKPSRWFWGPNHQTAATGFEAQTGKSFTTLVLRLNQETHHHFEIKPGETIATSFEAILEKTVATSFEVKLEKTVVTSFEAKPLETVATGFDAKPVKIILVVLRPNHSQTVDLGFKAQSRNLHSSSPRAQCRPHTAPPNLSIVRPLSTQPVRSFPVLCIRSPTPATILVATLHAAPATCTPRDKQAQFSKWNKGKRKIEWNCPWFKFKARQVNDSSQSNEGTNHLVS
jgi:hypothetical protein